MESKYNLTYDSEQFETLQVQKKVILDKLRDQKCRITKQRLLLLDIIMDGECSCCKEIYYEAIKQDSKIGAATVYRMVNTLEEIGAIRRKDIHCIMSNENCDTNKICTIKFEDETEIKLPENKWKQVVSEGLKSCGYVYDCKLKSIVLEQTNM